MAVPSDEPLGPALRRSEQHRVTAELLRPT